MNDIKTKFHNYIDKVINDLDSQIQDMEKDPSIDPEYLEFVKLSKKQAQIALTDQSSVTVDISKRNPSRLDIVMTFGKGDNL